MFFLASFSVQADNFELLKGYWTCMEGNIATTLEIQRKDQLIYNGKVKRYEIYPNVLRVQEEYGIVDYFYQINQNRLTILTSEGIIPCQRSKKPTQLAKPPGISPPPQGRSQHWPPPYVRPPGRVSENTTDPQALLYKFAGRWDNVSTNTLTNLYLKPDGTYSMDYEAGYSGIFQDQGGYQTGNWGVAGTEANQGRWYIKGNLLRGTITLIDMNGQQINYQYQMHIKNGEHYSGEYFFNGKLYSVNYIYR
ncbi:MAG: hypothetical protein R3240_03990 [Gammaproteobacteria bacterium]|nr:hypothetical protein [Gammaproteobacteria bacterium]